jgi:OOP family OmpA-OmpF porin
MNKHFYSTMALLAMFAAPAAHAQDEKLYAGLALSEGGSAVLQAGQYGRIENTNNALGVRAFGGYHISEHVAIEAGYARFAKFTFDVPLSLDLSGMYVAAKGSIRLGESFSLSGKLGAVRHRIHLSAFGESDSAYKTRALIGIGANYPIGKNLSLGLELNDYGSLKGGPIRQGTRKIEAGLGYHF